MLFESEDCKDHCQRLGNQMNSLVHLGGNSLKVGWVDCRREVILCSLFPPQNLYSVGYFIDNKAYSLPLPFEYERYYYGFIENKGYKRRKQMAMICDDITNRLSKILPVI